MYVNFWLQLYITENVINVIKAHATITDNVMNVIKAQATIRQWNAHKYDYKKVKIKSDKNNKTKNNKKTARKTMIFWLHARIIKCAMKSLPLLKNDEWW